MFRLLLAIAMVAISNLIAADVSGKWTGTMETNGRLARVFMTLNQHGQEVSGSVATGDETRPVAIEKAEVHGDRLTFEVHDNINRIVTFRLALTEGLISGETSDGDQVSKVTLSPVGSSRVYKVVGLANSAPVLLRKVEPEYTEEARAAKLQGYLIARGSR